MQSGGSRPQALTDEEHSRPSENITAQKQRVPVAQISARRLRRFKRESFPSDAQTPGAVGPTMSPLRHNYHALLRGKQSLLLLSQTPARLPRQQQKTRNSSSSDFRSAVTGLHNFADLKRVLLGCCASTALQRLCAVLCKMHSRG